MARKSRRANIYPLLGFRLLENQQMPTIVAVDFRTEAGHQVYAMTREILQQLAEAFRVQAAKMPRKKDQN